MSQYGPGDKPKVVRKRAARARRQQRVQQQTANARPLSQRPTRPAPVPTARSQRQTQQRAQNARPLSSKPVRPKQVVRPLAPSAKPPRVTRAAPSEGPRDVRQIQRGVAVRGYDQLTGRQKRQRVRQAQNRVETGHADESDKAILHAHTTRVAGRQKVIAAQRAMEALGSGRPHEATYSPQTAAVAKLLKIKPSERLTEPDAKGVRRVLDPHGNEVSRTAPIKVHAGSVATLPGVGKIVATLGPAATKGLEKTALPKVIKNIPKDAAELAVTSPSALAKSVVTAVKNPRKEGEALVGEYKKLAEHPGKFITEKPVTAALMLQPAARAPGLIAGKAARAVGAQTLARESAALPNTALREVRTRSRAAGRNIAQTVADRRAVKAGRPPIVTARQIDTRVDESYAAAQKHTERVKGSIMRRAKKSAKKVPKADRKEFLSAMQEEAQSAATAAARRRTAHEFGATTHVGETAHPKAPKPGSPELRDVIAKVNRVVELQRRGATAGERSAAESARDRVLTKNNLRIGSGGRIEPAPVKAILRPRNPQEGHIFDSEADAQRTADYLNEQGQTIPKGYGGLTEGHIAGRKYRNEPVPVKYVVRDAGHDKFAVVPKQVSDRLNLHSRIGKERAVPAIVMRQSRKAFSKTVLPTRPSWLSGQAIEGTVRSAVARAGPLSYARTARLARRHPELYASLEERAVPGGVLGRAAAHEIADRTLNEEFRGESDLARRLTEWGKAPGVKQTRAAYDAYTRFVFDKVNGKGLEGIPQKAMLGRALKQSPLMDNHLLGLSNKAIDEAARGLRGTETQAHLAREVVRSYGKYAGFSPRLRSLIVHWTPFLPWYLNTAKFLGQTLPRDHPMMAALMADMSSATEDWRKQQGLSLRYKNENSLPGWMLGGYPIQGGKNMLRIGHYLPSGTVEPASDITGLILPQFSSAYGAVKYGKDWKGDDLKHPDGTPYNDGEKFLYAVQQMMEAMVPLYGQGTQVLQSGDKKAALLKSIRPVGTVAVHRDRGPAGAAPDLGGLELSPLQIQQIETGG